jgi:hypothetical protein
MGAARLSHQVIDDGGETIVVKYRFWNGSSKPGNGFVRIPGNTVPLWVFVPEQSGRTESIAVSRSIAGQLRAELQVDDSDEKVFVNGIG